LQSRAKNKRWFSALLRDNPSKGEGEKWGTGSHEWLECTLIIEVIERSAGMVKNVQLETASSNKKTVLTGYM